MGPSPKQQRRAGAPKAKGAVRAKSGCYTCRIRRKKCDEQADEKGHCQTCVRLQLQCLGFGAKRPEWLRENRNVVELREKIKTFLAAQGKIKGHSGSGPRSSDLEPTILPLTLEHSSSSSSPRTPTLSVSSGDEMHVRSQYHPMRDIHPYAHGTSLHPMQELSPDSPLPPSRGPLYPQDLLLPHYQTSIMTPSLDSWPNNQANSSQLTTYTSPAITSSFSASYNRNDAYFEEEEYPLAASVGVSGDFGHNRFMPRMTANSQDLLLSHYMQNVLKIQYLHADQSIDSIVWRLINESDSARDAACLLSDLHRKSIQRVGTYDDENESQALLQRVQRMPLKKTFTEGDALAGLCVVSYFLFSGGSGHWQNFLEVSCAFSLRMLYSPQYRGPADCLSRCSETVCLIVKTAMWFDVLASATLVRKPRFIDVFRDIFSDRAPATFDGVEVLEDPRLSMLPIMGCENHIVRALAEIADLAVWKMNERHKGSLSVPMLVQRGLEIEKTLDPRPRPRPPQYLHLSVDAELETRRHLTSEVFRASARVYLHSVLSGDFPGCPEIVDGVKDTVQCLQQVPEYTTTSRFVVRSVVFSICICGCLTDNTGYRAYFLKRLEEQQKESVGNCSTVMTLMREVWNKRASGQPVDWRQVMRESTVLLV